MPIRSTKTTTITKICEILLGTVLLTSKHVPISELAPLIVLGGFLYSFDQLLLENK